MPSHNSLVLLALLAAACSRPADRSATAHIDTLPNGALHVRSDAPRWADGMGWHVAQDLVITSPEQGDGEFGFVSAIAADPQGHVYVLDGQNNVIQQFDTAGTWIRSIGRKGGGPGEFTGAIGIAIRGSTLYVVDQTNIRISLFDTSGAYITSHPRNFANMGSWKWEGGLDTAGNLYDLRGQFTDSGPQWQLALLRPDSFTVADTFPIPVYEAGATLVKKVPGGMSRNTVVLPNTPTLARQFDPRGYLWFGVGNKYQIVQRHLKGDTVRIVERTWTPMPLTDSARARQDSLVGSLRRDGYTLPELATTVPAFDGLVIDEAGHLWVAPYGRRDPVWHVFDPEGVWLGPVTFPEPILKLSFQGGHYYGVTLDSLDVDHVVRGKVTK